MSDRTASWSGRVLIYIFMGMRMSTTKQNQLQSDLDKSELEVVKLQEKIARKRIPLVDSQNKLALAKLKKGNQGAILESLQKKIGDCEREIVSFQAKIARENTKQLEIAHKINQIKG